MVIVYSTFIVTLYELMFNSLWDCGTSKIKIFNSSSNESVKQKQKISKQFKTS